MCFIYIYPAIVSHTSSPTCSQSPFWNLEMTASIKPASLSCYKNERIKKESMLCLIISVKHNKSIWSDRSECPVWVVVTLGAVMASLTWDSSVASLSLNMKHCFPTGAVWKRSTVQSRLLYCMSTWLAFKSFHRWDHVSTVICLVPGASQCEMVKWFRP